MCSVVRRVLVEITDNTDRIKILSTQLGELNQFARTNIQLLVQWFIFFSTANYVMIGYFALKMSDAPLNIRSAFFCVATLYVALNSLAIGLCWYVQRWFISSGEAVVGMEGRLHGLTHSQPELVAVPPPYVLYKKVVLLMGVTVLTMLCTWVVMIGVTVRAGIPMPKSTQPTAVQGPQPADLANRPTVPIPQQSALSKP